MIFLGVSWVIHVFFIGQGMDHLLNGDRYSRQLLFGTGYGLLMSAIAWLLIHSRLLEPTRKFFERILQPMKLRIIDIIFVSLCAGIGEEILFRGSIQPFIGIWFTAILFVALHGYLNPKNWRISVYGLLMVLLTAGLGYLCELIGLLSAITAHTLFDIILLVVLTRSNQQQHVQEYEEVVENKANHEQEN